MSHIPFYDKTWQAYTFPKEDPKNIQIMWYTSWFLISHRKSANFAILRNTDKNCVSILLIFFESLKSSLIKMVTILLMPVKMTTLGLLRYFEIKAMTS